MRIILLIVTVVLFGSLATYGYSTWQDQMQRPPSQGDPCAASMTGWQTARLSVSGDITKEGVHKVSLDSLPRIQIKVSKSWGGGKVTVPSDFITADFTIENMPQSVKEAAPSRERTGRELLRFQITNLDAKVKSFSYPRRVLTGENIFQIVKENSFVLVYGSRGIVKLRGEAEATLTNRLFSGDNPARVKVSFEGNYNYATRAAALTKIEAEAHSPRPVR